MGDALGRRVTGKVSWRIMALVTIPDVASLFGRSSVGFAAIALAVSRLGPRRTTSATVLVGR